MQSATSTKPVEDFSTLFQRLASTYQFSNDVRPAAYDQLKDRVDQLGQKIIETMRDTAPVLSEDKATFTLEKPVMGTERVMELAVKALSQQYGFDIKSRQIGPAKDVIPLFFSGGDLSALNDKIGTLYSYIVSVTTNVDNKFYRLRPTSKPLQSLTQVLWEDRKAAKATDVDFITSDGKEIKAHSQILKLRSTSSSLPAGTPFEKGVVISCPESTRYVLEIVLEYVYLGSYQPKIPLNLDTISGLYQEADRWKFEGLQDWADDQLKDWLLRNVITELSFPQLFKLGLQNKDFLLFRCLKFIQTEKKVPLLLSEITSENIAQVTEKVTEGGYTDLEGSLLKKAMEFLKTRKA